MTASPAWIEAFLSRERLPDAYRELIDRSWRSLATQLARARPLDGKALVVGINGPQGSGKSTLAACLSALLQAEAGLRVATVSLDDFYLARAERQQRAEIVHPLLATRGVPGTHDVDLALRTLSELAEPLRLPCYDKARDDRAPPEAWPSAPPRVDVVLFEGWCVGAEPDPHDDPRPVNALEADADPHGAWRAYVDRQLAGPYAALWATLDVLVVLEAPDFECVRRWRGLQEAKLRELGRGGMTEAELDRFVMHYERLTRRMARTLPARADAHVRLDRQQTPQALILRGRLLPSALQLENVP